MDRRKSGHVDVPLYKLFNLIFNVEVRFKKER